VSLCGSYALEETSGLLTQIMGIVYFATHESAESVYLVFRQQLCTLREDYQIMDVFVSVFSAEKNSCEEFFYFKSILLSFDSGS
jgi:hypothetical protein